MKKVAASIVLVLCVAAAAAHAGPASSAAHLQLGIADSGGAYFDDPETFYTDLEALHARILRVELHWGGALGVAQRHPHHATDPADRAYDWSMYDRIDLAAADAGVRLVFTIFGTPPWANGGQRPTRAPARASTLQDFAYAASERYSGSFARDDGIVLPAVRYWTAWNEPNLPLGLQPQWRRVGGRWVIQSALDYARICDAVVAGVHATLIAGERVACGDTAPRGNNEPTGVRPTVSPLAFLRAMSRAGAGGFDAYAHHPYPSGPSETPATPPRSRTAVTFGNIGVLVAEVTRLYGPVPIWVDEYGYQTDPPDADLGVSPALQARYLTQAVALARANPRIQMLLWFLVRDDDDTGGWQSGLVSARGVEKPAFRAFARAAARS
jgi:Glycosyl hydrolase catalytic core